jgi:GntR family transcriptional regulator/MocR family aminotransferase
MKIKTTLTDEDFCMSAHQKGVKLSSLSQYYINPTPEIYHTFIINYSSLDESAMREAIEKIYEVVIE